MPPTQKVRRKNVADERKTRTSGGSSETEQMLDGEWTG